MTDGADKVLILTAMWGALGAIGWRWAELALVVVLCGTAATCTAVTS